MPPSNHPGEEHLLPFKTTVVGEEDASGDGLPNKKSEHANETLGMWKVVPTKPLDATPTQNLMQVEWSIQSAEHSFHHFPKPPKELRLQIWEEVLPDPRIVQFQLDDPANVVLDGHLADRMMQAWPGSSRQDQLLACCESKDVFKKNYRQIVLLKTETSSTLFAREYKRFWSALTTEFPAMKALTMVYGTFNTNFHQHITTNNAPRLLELNREIEVMEHEKNASTMYGILKSQVRWLVISFVEEYQDSISFGVARMCFEALRERRYYEVIDLAPADGRTERVDTSYFAKRPIGPCYGKDMRVYFADAWIQHCTTGGDLLSPYDGIEKLFREKTFHEREEEDRQRDVDWTCYGGKVKLGRNL